MRSKMQCGSISRAASTALALAVVLVPAFVATPWAQAAGFSFCVVYSFKGYPNDGISPYGRLVLDRAGNLYGTTQYGGSGSAGTVFKVDKGCDQPGKKDTVLHNFTQGQNPPDGLTPWDGLVLAAGKLYGTTEYGGDHNFGSVFKVNTTGGTDPVVVANFDPTIGEYPKAGLVRDPEGNFYGTTAGGHDDPYGSVFKLSTSLKLEVLYTFKGQQKNDGATPDARLVLDAAGNLYGTTEKGGAFDQGTVFKLNKTSKAYEVLHAFRGSKGEGTYPVGGVILDSRGNIYGTTNQGGFTGHNDGMVFKLNSKGTLINEYDFSSGDGQNPTGDLVLDPSGNIWGTTPSGGSGSGVVFELDKTFQRIFLYRFSSFTDGGAPYAGLVLDSSGVLYGTTTADGPNGNGTVFKLCQGGCE